MNTGDRQKDIHTFDLGMINDPEINHSRLNAYHYAQNMQLIQDGDMMALSQWGGETPMDVGFLPVGFSFLKGFSCTGTYGPQKEQRRSAIIFARNASGVGLIYIYDETTDNFHLIYDGNSRPSRERMYVLDLREIDAYCHGEGRDYYCYWIDWQNPLRRIRIHVEDPSQLDNSGPGLSPLYVPNEPDCLLVQRLNVVDMPTIENVLQSSGSLLSGSYQFAYRYFNTETKQYSAVSLITNPVPIIPVNTNTAGRNEVYGGGLDTQTQKAIQIRIDKSHFHHLLYDSIQLFVIRNTGDSREISMLAPSSRMYGSPNQVSAIVYKGSEPTEITTEEELATAEASIETAKTIEVSENRLYLANIKYANLDYTPPSSIQGETIDRAFSVNSALLDNAPVDGYASELNCALYKGHFRGEVYRYSVVHFDKFMVASRPEPISFPLSGRYDENNHAATWRRNWANPSTGDWKFPSRENQEGHIFYPNGSGQIKAFGLRVSGIDNHPSWSYGCAIFRRKRIPNILGQTPVINGVACQGVPSYFIRTDPQVPNPSFWVYKDWYNYDGSMDTFMPKVMSHGHAKSLMAQDALNGFPYPRWQINYSPNSSLSESPSGDNPKVDLYYLYPLEYLANSVGPYLNFDPNQSLVIRPIDAVALQAFNIYRGSDSTFIPGDTRYENDTLLEYGFVFHPVDSGAYFYNRVNDPGALLRGSAPLNLTCSPQIVRTSNIWLQEANGREIQITNSPCGHEKARHIRSIDGLNSLIREMRNIREDENIVISDYISPQGNTFVNPRAMIVSGDGDVIGDPTVYAAGFSASDFDAMFGVNADPIDASAISPSPDISTPMPLAYRGQIIPSNSSVVCFVANIEAGLTDDRYGEENAASEYIWTGAYTKISELDISTGDVKTLDVWGGDCYITRLTAQIRNTKPRLDYYGGFVYEDPYSLLFTIDSNVSHAEIIDLWVESAVNGQHISRSNSSYPSGIETRDPGHVNWGDPDPVYSYPDAQRARAIEFTPAYLYNDAYSEENEVYRLFGLDVRERVKDSVQERIHRSTPKIFNSSTIGFDRFLAMDRFDLDGTFGAINKLVRGANKRMYAIQDDGVAMLFLGQRVVEDTTGTMLALSSGDAIGYASYMSDNSETGGAYGIQNLGAAVQADSGILCLDQKRSQIFLIGSSISPKSYGRVSDVISEDLSQISPGDIVGFYDPRLKRAGFFSNIQKKGITYLDVLDLFETSLLSSSANLMAGIPAGERLLMLSEIGAFLVGNDGSDKGTFLGESSVSYVAIEAAGREYRGIGKVLSTVSVQSEQDPHEVHAFGYGIYSEESRVDPNGQRRQDYVHYNEFSDANGKRLRAPAFRILVTTDSGDNQDLLIRNIVVKYRVDHRQR